MRREDVCERGERAFCLMRIDVTLLIVYLRMTNAQKTRKRKSTRREHE